jgi:hypothetical protein
MVFQSGFQFFVCWKKAVRLEKCDIASTAPLE